MPFSMMIRFDNPYACYYAGQTISGVLTVNLDKPKKLRGITIKIKGESEVEWTETENRRGKDGKDESHTVHCTGSEEYFENKFYVVGRASGELELPAGQHVYPFQCPLPQTLPSSFEGEYGHIRYTVKAVLDRPWKFDQEAKAAFTVVAPLDLNLIGDVKEPIQFEKQKVFCCFCCKSGPLVLTVHLPAGGFVPGQTIPFQVEVENGSNIRVRPVNIVLRKEVTWHASSPHHKTKTTKTDMAKLAMDDEVPAHSSKSFSQDITVPAVPPSNLANCGIIDLEYIFKVEAVAKGCHKNLNARIPIVMGTIPLLSGPTAFKFGPSGPNQPAQPTAPVGPVGPSQPSYPVGPAGPTGPAGPSDPPPPSYPGAGGAGAAGTAGGWNIPPPGAPDILPSPAAGGSVAPSAPPLYPQLPPPSYEESAFGGSNIKDSTDSEHTMGIGDFTPRYPVWNFGPSAPPVPEKQ